MSKYECIRGVVTSKGVVGVGEVVELSDYEAKILSNKFIAYSEPKPEFTSEIRVAEAPVIEHGDPVMPAKRGRPPRGR